MPDSFTSVGVESLLRALPALPVGGMQNVTPSTMQSRPQARVTVDRTALEGVPLAITLTMDVAEWREYLAHRSYAGLGPGERIEVIIRDALKRFDRVCNFEHEVEG
jgi:hypothetical protein